MREKCDFLATAQKSNIFTVLKNKPTHFLHLCGNPSKKIVIV